MNNKLLYGILIVFGSVIMLLMAFPFGMIFSLAFWIYLGVMLWKRKRISHEKIEPQLAAKHLKRLKTLFVVAILSFIIAIAGIVMHNIQSSLSQSEEYLYFFIGIIPLYIFILLSVVGLVIFLKVRQKPS